MIVRIFESFVKATDESESPEAVANLVWSVFVWWSQISDTSKLLSLQNKLLSKKLSSKDYMSLKEICPFCDKVYDESEYSRCPYFAEGKYRNASDECISVSAYCEPILDYPQI